MNPSVNSDWTEDHRMFRRTQRRHGGRLERSNPPIRSGLLARLISWIVEKLI